MQYHTIFPGGLVAPSRNAIDWGPQGLLAYGACTYVVVADVVDTMKRIQTLDGHGRAITRLRWAREQLQFRNEANYSLVLASGDEGGSILVWKIAEAHIIASLNPDGHEKLGAVIDMEWHPDKPHLLASVHAPSSLVLWNVDTSSLVWRCDFGETLTSLSMNPFDKQHVCLSSSQGWIYFVRDFKEEAKPVRVDVKYRINSGQPGADSSAKTPASNDAFQHMLFSPHHRNIVYFVLERRILIFDLTIHQTVGSIGWDKTKPAFRTLLVSKHHEHMLFALHEDGSLTAWRRRDAHSQSFAYQATIDVIRISKQTRKRDRGVVVTGAVISPSHRLLVSLTSSDGVTWCVAYEGPTVPVDQNPTGPTLLICGELECVTSAISSISVWNSDSAAADHNEVLEGGSGFGSAFGGTQTASYLVPGASPQTLGLSGSSKSQLSNLVAVGTHDGRLLLVDMVENAIQRMFSVQPGCALRGVRWISASKVICFTTESIDKTMHRNRIKLVDLGTGQITEIRKKNEPEPTFIRGIRLSPSKQYLIVLLKDQPFQVWELKTGSLLRSLPFQHLTALEWNPNNLATSLTTGSTQSSASSSLNNPNSTSGPSGNLTSVSTSSGGSNPVSAASSLNAVQMASIIGSSLLQPPSQGPITNSSSFSLSPAFANNLNETTSLGGVVCLPSFFATSGSTVSSFGHGSHTSSTYSSSLLSGSMSSALPSSYPSKPSKEQFVFSNPDGTLHFYQVENNQVQALPGMKVEPGVGIIASIAWKGNILVAGDTNGTIMSYSLDKKKAHLFETGKGLVRRIRFGPSVGEGATGSGSHNILVLFNDGDFGVWDLEFNVRVSISSYFRQRDLKALDLDWWNNSQPIIATTDGAIRLVDRSLSHGSNSPLLFSHIQYPLNCPLILPPRQALYLKTMLSHPDLVEGGSGRSNTPSPSPLLLTNTTSTSTTNSSPPPTPHTRSGSGSLMATTTTTTTTTSSSPPTNAGNGVAISTSSQDSSPSHTLAQSMASSLTGLVPDTVLASLATEGLTVAERGLLIAKYFGNFSEQRFWTLVIHAFKHKRTPPIFKGGSLLGPSAYNNASSSTASTSSLIASTSADPAQKPTSPPPNGPLDITLAASSSALLGSSNIVNASQTIVIDATEPAPATTTTPEALPVYFDLLLDPAQLKTLHMNGAALHEKKRAQSYQLTQSITDFHLTLGQKEKAMELLLETPPDNAMYYADVLKACVVAASLSPETFRNTVKLVATSLIANGSVDEGVQLLSLIGKSLDACRYLQSHDRWIEAAQLAKLTLNYDDAGHIYKKWTEHLVSEGQLTEAIEIEITLGEYDVVLALLHKANLFELSALFALAAKENGILTDEWLKEHPTDPDMSPLASTPATLPALLESVFLDYGWYLHKIGCKAAATHFLSEHAGEAGREALTNLNLTAPLLSPSLSPAPSSALAHPEITTPPSSPVAPPIIDVDFSPVTHQRASAPFSSLVGSGFLFNDPPAPAVDSASNESD